MIELTKEESQILLHTVGLNNLKWYEKNKIYKIKNNRNYFYTSIKNNDYISIKSLIDKKLMIQGSQAYNNNSYYFFATEQGILTAQQIALQSMPKISRSKKRYELYIHCEANQKFGEWIKDKYWDNYRKENGCY